MPRYTITIQNKQEFFRIDYSHAFSTRRKNPKIMKIHENSLGKKKNLWGHHITLKSPNSCFFCANGVSQNQYRGETACHKEETDLEEDVSENEVGRSSRPLHLPYSRAQSNKKDPATYEVERGIQWLRIPRSDDKPRMQAATEHCC